MRTHHPLSLLAALLLCAACDRARSLTDLEPQFHEELGHQDCNLAEVDCVAELGQPAYYQKTKNLQRLGFSARTVPHGSNTYNSDLAFWGRHIYQGSFDGFRIVDISQPDNPAVVRDYAECSPGSTQGNQGDVVVWQNILVRAWNSPAGPGASCGGQPVPPGWEGVHVFDISNPLSPQLVAALDMACGAHTVMAVPDPEKGRLLVYSASASGFFGCTGLDLVDIPLTNPAAATYRGLVEATVPCHDGGVILGEVRLLACAGGDGFTVFSLASADGAALDNPVLLYTRSVAGVSVGHSATFTWDGQVLVFGHEPGGGVQPKCQAASSVIDRSLFFFESRTGNLLGSFVQPRAQTATENCSWHYYNVVPVDNRYLLVSGNYQSGVSVVDFTNPTAAVEIAYADPAPLVNPADEDYLVMGGDWAAYWYNGFIYESDMRRGLLVWRLNDPAVSGALKFGWLNPQTQETTVPFRGRR